MNLKIKAWGISSGILIRGVIAAITLSVISIFLANYIPYLGSTTIALILGILVTKESLIPGSKFIEKKILPIAIALLGATISIESVQTIGTKGIVYILLIISITIISSIALAKLFKINQNLSLLIGTGNAVCGSSAILSASKVLNSDETEVATSIALINFLGVTGIFIIPFLAYILKFDLNESSILMGSTLQSVGNVTASSSFIMGSLNLSIIVKMLRVATLSLILIIYSFLQNKGKKNKVFKLPTFIIFFIILFIAANFNFLPDQVIVLSKELSKLLFILAMSAIGLSINIKKIFRLGKDGFKIALLNWIIQIISAIVLIKFIF